jgi:hypothetical protein
VSKLTFKDHPADLSSQLGSAVVLDELHRIRPTPEVPVVERHLNLAIVTNFRARPAEGSCYSVHFPDEFVSGVRQGALRFLRSAGRAIENANCLPKCRMQKSTMKHCSKSDHRRDRLELTNALLFSTTGLKPNHRIEFAGHSDPPSMNLGPEMHLRDTLRTGEAGK